MEVWNKDKTLTEKLSELFAFRKKLRVFPEEPLWMDDSEKLSLVKALLEEVLE